MPDKHLTQEQFYWIGEATRRAASKVLRRYVAGALIGFLLVVAGLGYIFWDIGERGKDARGVVCRIIKSGDKQTYLFEREGTIDKAQLDRALRVSAEYRKALQPATNCDAKITPPPPPFVPKGKTP